MNIPTYSLCKPSHYVNKDSKYGHNIFFLKKEITIVPQTFSAESINPSNFLQLKNEILFNSMFIVDRIKPNAGMACIMDHINRSGYNFLVGKTPLNDFPTFPDMTNIYSPIDGLKRIVVHTIGPERFSLEQDLPFIVSEIVGLVSPVWHYIGVRVFAKTNLTTVGLN